MTVAFAAFVKGALGVGFPILATPVLASLVDPQTTVVAISVPAFLMNLFQLNGEDSLAAVALRHFRFISGAAGGTLAGAMLLKTLDPATLRLVLGLLVLFWLGLTGIRIPLTLSPAAERWLAAPLGAVNGLIGGATGIFFPILAIYLLALGIEKRRFIQSISFLFLLQQSVQLVTAAAVGIITGPRLAYALAVCLPVALGFATGLRAQRRIDPGVFRQLIRWILVITALQLVYRGLAD